ncbi:MAG: chorismate synthase [Candidatus Methylarchaceae archaeon HK01B]|nr:chorismate synthase [Candidatus Methylarchaceae archaeon HK02M1]MCP8319247.1 chorismate synthase [Candidatus Methylarchaceae archaeon HK01B]
MTGNLLGERFVVVSFGESHGRCVGGVIDGCPAGLPLSEDDIQRDLDLRRPGVSSTSTKRSEEDRVELLSGVFEGYTTGSPICALIWNKDVDSKPYEKIRKTPRPGHADITAFWKYGGYNDWRGGGRFSGRVTATFVIAGAIAKKLISHTLGIDVLAYSIEIGGIRAREVSDDEAKKFRYSNEVRCPDLEVAEKMRIKILEERSKGDSIGGIIECKVLNVPVGLGEPVFSSLESDLSKALFSIPAVKGIESGIGFEVSRLRGSECNDPFGVKEGKIVTITNRAGGILGGISNGMPIVLRLAFKPTSSISKPQKSVNRDTLKEVDLVVPGRHDPCIVPRAVPVVEGIVACVIADHSIRAGLIPPVIKRGFKR